MGPGLPQLGKYHNRPPWAPVSLNSGNTITTRVSAPTTPYVTDNPLRHRQPPTSQTTPYVTDNPLRHRQPPTSQTTPYVTDNPLHHRQPPTSQTTPYVTDNPLRHRQPPTSQTTPYITDNPLHHRQPPTSQTTPYVTDSTVSDPLQSDKYHWSETGPALHKYKYVKSLIPVTCIPVSEKLLFWGNKSSIKI